MTANDDPVVARAIEALRRIATAPVAPRSTEPVRQPAQAPLSPAELSPAEAALAFVNRAGARLVCPHCWVDCPPGDQFAILVPAANNDPEFRRALSVLRLDALPVIPRSEPLDSLQSTPGCRRCRPVAVG